MYSHNRTLLASAGFADPDKKDPEHDLACRYLSDEFSALRFLPDDDRGFADDDEKYELSSKMEIPLDGVTIKCATTIEEV